MRACLIRLAVSDCGSADERRAHAAELVRARTGDDLVVLPEPRTTGGWAYDDRQAGAETLDGPAAVDAPTVRAMSAAAGSAGVWLHAGTVVERGSDGSLDNTALVVDRKGALRRYGLRAGRRRGRPGRLRTGRGPESRGPEHDDVPAGDG